MPLWTQAVLLAAEPSSASSARDFVCAHLLQHRLQHLVDDIRLVVSELTTNAMVHARTPFTVTLQQDGQRVKLTVQDGASSVPKLDTANSMDLGGRGLVIVDMLSCDWGVIAGPGESKSVWATFDAADRGTTDGVSAEVVGTVSQTQFGTASTTPENGATTIPVARPTTSGAPQAAFDGNR